MSEFYNNWRRGKGRREGTHGWLEFKNLIMLFVVFFIKKKEREF